MFTPVNKFQYYIIGLVGYGVLSCIKVIFE